MSASAKAGRRKNHLNTNCIPVRRNRAMSLHTASFIFWFSLLLLPLFFPVAVHSKRSRTGIATAGDIIIGGLIPVHFSPNFSPHPGNSSCSGAFHLRGYKGVEALMYAVNLINSDATVLPDLTLGVDIKDTCGSVDYAIMESLSFEFIRRAFTASERTECTENKNNPAGQEFASGSAGKRINGSFPGSGSMNSESLSREESNISGLDC